MSSKTPYEVRLDILTLAKQYHDDMQRLENSVAELSFRKALEEGTTSVDDWEFFAPKQYTLEELTQSAQQMYDFVLTK